MLPPNAPVLSVIVPIYNVQPYIEQCLTSIITQRFEDFELILIDDGSKDNSVSIANHLLTPTEVNFRIIIHEKNKGLSEARNTGIAAAQGRYITFIDADDWIPSGAFEHLYQAIHTSENVIVCGNTIAFMDEMFTPYWVDVKHQQEFEKSEAIIRMLGNKVFLDTAWAKMYPKKLFIENDIRFPAGRFFEDTPTNLRLFNKAEKVVAIPHDVYYYRRNRPGSILHQNNFRLITDRLAVFADIYQYLITETDVDHDYSLRYYLEVLVYEYRSVFNKYQLSIDEQYLIVKTIDKTIKDLKKHNERADFRKEIGLKFNWLMSNFLYKNKALFHCCHNSQFSLFKRLIDIYLADSKKPVDSR